MKLRFVVSGRGTWPRSDQGVFTLVIDNWDDYHYKTLFTLFHGNGNQAVEIGDVKIGQRGMAERDPHTLLPGHFNTLQENFFSLGQSREYYERLMALPKGVGRAALLALRDIAADEKIFATAKNEPVLHSSLLRSIPSLTVSSQFRRIANGQLPLTPYSFAFTKRMEHPTPDLEITIDADPESKPPTNVHVLIGPNGVGKTQLLWDLATAAAGESNGDSSLVSNRRSDDVLTSVVHVSFSAFDRGRLSPGANTIPVHHVGLTSGNSATLADQFADSLRLCSRRPRLERWLNAMRRLELADPLLQETGLSDNLREGELQQVAAARIFGEMSSGHQIVILTMTRLVELVEERTLIMLDEPETHLHPPLLSALVRCISDLAVDRNGLAVLATHSPVVLQEVPRTCVWMLQRSGGDVRAMQLKTETFGESVSRLTSEVFRLDLHRTGFASLLREQLGDSGGSAIDVLERLGDQLGSEGRFALAALADDYV